MSTHVRSLWFNNPGLTGDASIMFHTAVPFKAERGVLAPLSQIKMTAIGYQLIAEHAGLSHN